jgi:hypothetical protein
MRKRPQSSYFINLLTTERYPTGNLDSHTSQEVIGFQIAAGRVRPSLPPVGGGIFSFLNGYQFGKLKVIVKNL